MDPLMIAALSELLEKAGQPEVFRKPERPKSRARR